MRRGEVNRPDLDAIEARANAATDGWELKCIDWKDRDGTTQLDYFKYLNNGTPQVEGPIYCPAYDVRGLNTLGNHECSAMEKPNAEFVFHARTDVPALIAYIRYLEDEVHEYKETVAVMESGVIDAAMAESRQPGVRQNN